MITTEQDAVAKNFFVPSFGVFFMPSESFTVGLGVYAPFGLGTEWDLINLPASYGNATGFSRANEHYSDHQVIAIQPTAAFKLSDKISVGVGASYIWGKMDIIMGKLAFNPMAQEVAPGITMWNALQAGILGAGFTPPGNMTADQARIPVELNLKGTGSAYGFNFGLLFELSKKLSVGLSGQYYTDLKLSGDLAQTLIMAGDAQKIAAFQNIPDAVFADNDDPTGTQNKDELMAMFSGQNFAEETTAKADLPLPMTIGGGIAYKASPKLTLTADVSWTNWAAWDNILIKPEGDDDITMKEDWSSTIEAGAGMEFLAVDNEASQFFVRAGFYTTASPSPNTTISPTILDPNRRYVIAGGIGLNLGKVAFNLAGEYVLFGKKDVPAAEYEFDDMGISDNYAGIYKANALVFTFGTTIAIN